jgi:hypothetical protein
MTAAFEDCCGMGCNNCILDRFLENSAAHPGHENITNLFRPKEYQKFRCREIIKLRKIVYQFTFELVCDREEPFAADEQLIAEPISYLLLRARRDFRDTAGVTNPLFNDCLEFLNPPKSSTDGEGYFRSEPQRFDKGTPEIYFCQKYTPFEVNEQMRTFKIIVKLKQHGKMSNFFSRLHVGSVCEFKVRYQE